MLACLSSNVYNSYVVEVLGYFCAGIIIRFLVHHNIKAIHFEQLITLYTFWCKRGELCMGCTVGKTRSSNCAKFGRERSRFCPSSHGRRRRTYGRTGGPTYGRTTGRRNPWVRWRRRRVIRIRSRRRHRLGCRCGRRRRHRRRRRRRRRRRLGCAAVGACLRPAPCAPWRSVALHRWLVRWRVSVPRRRHALACAAQ